MTAGALTDLLDPVGPPLDDLRRQVAGPVLPAHHPDLPQEAGTFNLAVTHRPAVVVGATSADDVAATVRWAVSHRLPVAVQATGHGPVAPVVDGVLVTTRRMRGVTVDPVRRTARIAAGVRWAEVVAAAAPHGLAPLSGSSSGVGAVGYTLGGGLGLLGRRYGFAADHVHEVELVDATGALRRVTAASDPDLFWAVRGGKGNVGIVTEMVVGLFPVRTVFGGGIFYAAGSTTEVLHAYRAWAPSLPEATTTAVALLRLPPLPQVPEPLRGKFVVALRMAHDGPQEEGEALVAPMARAGEVVLSHLGELPYSAADAIHQDPVDPVAVWERGALLRDLTAGTVDALVAAAGPSVDVPLIKVELRQLGGALGRAAAVPNAVAGREGAYSVFVLGPAAPGLEEAVPAAGRGVLAALAPWATGTSVLNFLGSDATTPDRVASAWQPEVRARLVAVRRAVDPHGVFRSGHVL